jgi:hypothetical protein
MVEEIQHEYLRNRDNTFTVGTYPRTVAEAYNYLCNYKKDPKILARLLGQAAAADHPSTGVAFVQNDAPQHQDNDASTKQGAAFAVYGGNNQRKKICKRCGIENHTSVECGLPQEKVDAYRQSQQPNQGVQHLIHAVNWENTTPDEAPNYAFLNKVIFSTDGSTKCTEFDCNGAVTRTHKSTVFSQDNSGIPSTWDLLDNQSTCDIVSNPKLSNKQ